MMLLERLDTLRGKPDELIEMKSTRQLTDDLRRANYLLWLAGLAALLASSLFVIKYFAGGEFTPDLWSNEQWFNATLGLLITLAITLGQALLYVSGYKGPAAVLALLVVVFFGFFSEISQSMEREDATVRHRSAQSPVFQAAIGSIGRLTDQAASPSPAQRELAAALGELAQWQAEESKKAACHTCSKYSTRTIGSRLAAAQGRITAAREQLRLSRQGNQSVLKDAITQAKALEYDEDKHYAMIRLLKSLFGFTGIYASFLFSVVIIGTFEYIFHFIGSYVANHRKALQLLGLNADGTPFESQAPAGPRLPIAKSRPEQQPPHSPGASQPASTPAPAPKPHPLPGLRPADRFARDWLRINYFSKHPASPMPGFSPYSPTKHQGANLTGKAKTGGKPPVTESVYLSCCKQVRTGQLRPSRPAFKKTLQQLRIGPNQMERQVIADYMLKRMRKEGIVRDNPRYTGPDCGLSEFLPVLQESSTKLELTAQA